MRFLQRPGWGRSRWGRRDGGVENVKVKDPTHDQDAERPQRQDGESGNCERDSSRANTAAERTGAPASRLLRERVEHLQKYLGRRIWGVLGIRRHSHKG